MCNLCMLINKHTGSLSWAACDVLCLGAMKINSSLTYEGCVDYAAANFQVCMFDANVESVLMNNGMILCFDACACLLYHFVRVFYHECFFADIRRGALTVCMFNANIETVLCLVHVHVSTLSFLSDCGCMLKALTPMNRVYKTWLAWCVYYRRLRR